MKELSAVIGIMDCFRHLLPPTLQVFFLVVSLVNVLINPRTVEFFIGPSDVRSNVSTSSDTCNFFIN